MQRVDTDRIEVGDLFRCPNTHQWLQVVQVCGQGFTPTVQAIPTHPRYRHVPPRTIKACPHFTVK